MAGEAANVRGPCSSCGAQLATDQRYCVECGQRVGPPMALPYALPAGAGIPPEAAASRWAFALPIPVQTVSTFAALALGFGVVVGTAISPNLAGIVAAPSPTVVAEAPPETPPTPPVGAGGGGGGSGGGAAPAPPLASTTVPSSGGDDGGGGNGGGKKKKKKKKKAPVDTRTGTVVRVNPVAQSYTIAANNALTAIHTASLPAVGDQVKSPVRKLANGTYTEQGARTAQGTTDGATFLGTVTYCADLEQPSAPCDGSSATDHYVYTVSSPGASVLVSAPYPAAGSPPQVGAVVTVGVHIGATFQPVAPASWAPDPGGCTPPYDEQHGNPAGPPVTPSLTQATVTSNPPAEASDLEAVVQTVCPGATPKLVLSADDIRESGRDLVALDVPAGIDLGKLSPGEAVYASLGVSAGGQLSLKGITSDTGAAGADDTTQGQGTLAGR
jgi:hypothetical protein